MEREFKLMRHKENRDGRPAGVLWVKILPEVDRFRAGPPEGSRHPGAGIMEVSRLCEIRSAGSVGGNDSLEPNEIYGPDTAPFSGFENYSAIQRFYEETTPDEIGRWIAPLAGF